jgi:hypothetical protein
MFVAVTQHTSGPLTDLSVVVSFQRSPGTDVCPGSGLDATDDGDAREVAAVGGTDELPPQAASSSPQPNTHEDEIRTRGRMTG